MSIVLAVDVGTTAMKVAVVENAETIIATSEILYPMNSRPGGQRDIDTHHWWNAFLHCCQEIREFLSNVEVISLSVSTPGTVAMDEQGEALSPAVLFLDGRSQAEAQFIRDVIGEDYLLEHTSNLPVSGGSTAPTLLWWKKYHPDMFEQTYMFGHTNTLFGKRLTGNWGMDPSTASLSALYNTSANDGTWNNTIAEQLEIPMHKLPPIISSWQPVGSILPQWSKSIGLPTEIPILMGGNDAMCAALDGGVTKPGTILDICGTCEIICIGLDRSLPGRNYNIRCHVLPDMWSTLYVLNTGGKALEWFQQNFCRELTPEQFYCEYVPELIETYFQNPASWILPEYDVYLAGDRYSTDQKYASFQKLNIETTREHLLMCMIKANTEYMAKHINEMKQKVPLSDKIHITGGGVSESFICCKKYWMGDYDYEFRSQSSVMGAAKLGQYYLENNV